MFVKLFRLSLVKYVLTAEYRIAITADSCIASAALPIRVILPNDIVLIVMARCCWWFCKTSFKFMCAFPYLKLKFQNNYYDEVIIQITIFLQILTRLFCMNCPFAVTSDARFSKHSNEILWLSNFIHPFSTPFHSPAFSPISPIVIPGKGLRVRTSRICKQNACKPLHTPLINSCA